MAQDAAGATGARVSPQVDTLIRAAQRGDQDAFEQLVRTYDQSVLRLAMNLLRSPKMRAMCIRRHSCGSTGTFTRSVSTAVSTLALSDCYEYLSGPVAEAEGP